MNFCCTNQAHYCFISNHTVSSGRHRDCVGCHGIWLARWHDMRSESCVRTWNDRHSHLQCESVSYIHRLRSLACVTLTKLHLRFSTQWVGLHGEYVPGSIWGEKQLGKTPCWLGNGKISGSPLTMLPWGWICRMLARYHSYIMKVVSCLFVFS